MAQFVRPSQNSHKREALQVPCKGLQIYIQLDRKPEKACRHSQRGSRLTTGLRLLWLNSAVIEPTSTLQHVLKDVEIADILLN